MSYFLPIDPVPMHVLNHYSKSFLMSTDLGSIALNEYFKVRSID